MRLYDLNIFYREVLNEETEEYDLEDHLTIDVYIREEDEYGVRNYETPILISATPEESVALDKAYPGNEYGTDWWAFADEFITVAPDRLASLIKALPPLDADYLDIFTSLEPNHGWWVTKNKDLNS